MRKTTPRAATALASLAVLVMAISTLTGAALAQESQLDPQAMEQLMVKMMTPGQPHQQLGRMAGKWTTTMVSYQDGPEPVSSTGTFESEPILGGRYMLGRYHGTAMGQPFEGMSIDGYDNGKEQFFSLWFDTMGTGFYETWGTATADGKTVRHEGIMVFGPLEVPTRSETVTVDENTVKFTMWQTMGGQETKAMEISYQRR